MGYPRKPINIMAKFRIFYLVGFFFRFSMNKNFDTEKENSAREKLIGQIRSSWQKEDPDSFKFSPVKKSSDATLRTYDFVESVEESSTVTTISNEECLPNREKTFASITSQQLKMSINRTRRKYGEKETSLKNVFKESLTTYEKSGTVLDALPNFSVTSLKNEEEERKLSSGDEIEYLFQVSPVQNNTSPSKSLFHDASELNNNRQLKTSTELGKSLSSSRFLDIFRMLQQHRPIKDHPMDAFSCNEDWPLLSRSSVIQKYNRCIKTNSYQLRTTFKEKLRLLDEAKKQGVYQHDLEIVKWHKIKSTPPTACTTTEAEDVKKEDFEVMYKPKSGSVKDKISADFDRLYKLGSPSSTYNLRTTSSRNTPKSNRKMPRQSNSDRSEGLNESEINALLDDSVEEEGQCPVCQQKMKMILLEDHAAMCDNYTS